MQAVPLPVLCAACRGPAGRGWGVRHKAPLGALGEQRARRLVGQARARKAAPSPKALPPSPAAAAAAAFANLPHRPEATLAAAAIGATAVAAAALAVATSTATATAAVAATATASVAATAASAATLTLAAAAAAACGGGERKSGSFITPTGQATTRSKCAMASRNAQRNQGYENTPRAMEKYTNIYEPFLAEIMAVRTWQCLNGCTSLDWTHENCVVYTIRVLAPAFRISYLLTGIYLILLNWFVLSWPLIFRYNLFLPQGSMKPGNVTLNVCMLLWGLDFAFLAVAYTYAWTNSKRDWWWGWSLIGFRPHHTLLMIIYAIFFTVVALVGIISTHTALSHMWHVRNVWFAALLGLQCIMLVVGALGDAVDIGSPWGIQQDSRVASVLLSLRLRALVPVTVIFSVAAVFASWPPSYCLQC